ncbi:MAG TPA: hypothetical protein VMA34_12045 [Terracidiphilus sp.]|nr:hypothetical protein [Terracidiphilus sp.]
MNNLGWLSAAPNDRKSQDADQVIDGALKTLDLLGRIRGLHIHISAHRGRMIPPSSRAAKFLQELIRRYKDRIPLQDATYDDHRMRPYDVNQHVAPKTSESMYIDHCVVVTMPNVVEALPELSHVFEMRSILDVR